jgi:CheY-like chemotaxis protein
VRIRESDVYTGDDPGDGFRLAGMHDGDLQATMSMTLSAWSSDDNPGFAATGSSLLEREGMTVLGTAANGAEALRLAAEPRPDVLLVDIDRGAESRLELTRRPPGGPDPQRRRHLAPSLLSTRSGKS